MNSFWVEACDANWTKVGDGPIISVRNVSVTKLLDGPGSITFQVPLTDRNARVHLNNESRFIIYQRLGDLKLEVARGIVRQRMVDVGPYGWQLTIEGVDALEELRRRSVLFGRIFDQATIPDVMAQLVALVPGWSVAPFYDDQLVTARFDGVSVLKALQDLGERYGYHLRVGDKPFVLEVGRFGEDIGLSLIEPTISSPTLDLNTSIALIQTISQTSSSEAVANRIFPVGGGEGEAMLTLEHATFAYPYEIKSTMAPTGKLAYYIEDTDSIARYGVIEKTVAIKGISPITNSSEDLENAANALYEAATNWLTRHCVPQDTYYVTITHPGRSVRPGDKVHIRYSGNIEDGTRDRYVDIDDDFWVIQVTESLGIDSSTLTLQVSTVDMVERDAVEVIVGAIENIELRNLSVQPYPSRANYSDYGEIDATHKVIIPIKFTNATLHLLRCLLTLKTRPFRSTVAGSAAGGGTVVTSSGGGLHRHRIASVAGSPTSVGQFRPYNFGRQDPSNPTPNVIYLGLSSGSINADIYTYDADGNHNHTVTIPNHTHALTYGIYDDTQYPQTISLKINGVDVTADLGGPWGVTPGAVDVELNITDYLLNAVGGFQREHILEVSCASGQGVVAWLVEIFDVIQAIAVQ